MSTDLVLKTFKCCHSSSIDYKHWASQLFGDNKCIVSPVEKGKEGHDHVHFIGYTELDKKEFNTIKNEFSDMHPWHDEKTADGQLRYPNCRPIRAANKLVTELGFQYVMKTYTEKTPIEYFQGFTTDELAALKHASDEHVEDLKHGPKEHCNKRKYDGTPEECLRAYGMEYFRFCKQNNRCIRPQGKTDIYNGFLSHPDASEDWIRLVHDKIMH